MKHEPIGLDGASPVAEAPAGRSSARPRRAFLRPFLFALGPVVVLAGAVVAYLQGGRFVSTDNAYIHATIVPIAAQVSGPISAVSVRDNQQVDAGQILFTIDRRRFEIAVREADAALDKARSDVGAVQASYRQKAMEIGQAETDQAFRAREWDRQRRLAAQNVVSKTKLDQARHDYELAVRRVGILSEELSEIAASLDADPGLRVDDHAAVREALARRDAARLDLDHTVVRAPIQGRVNEAPSLGRYVVSGEPVFSLVADQDLWVEANFKETELTHLRPGQPVRIGVDTYSGRRWAGSVESVAQATGAVFSVLPAQNASGNWVKVVQRIPVRIAIRTEPDGPVLRAGMSAEVSVDTGYRRTLAGLVVAAQRVLGLP